MGIQPIDLQTLYSQMEKVGKQQGAEQSGVIANRERQEEANSVKSSESINDEKIAIDNNTDSKGSMQNRKYKKEKKDDESGEEENYIKDPKLGARVDISG